MLSVVAGTSSGFDSYCIGGVIIKLEALRKAQDLFKIFKELRKLFRSDILQQSDDGTRCSVYVQSDSRHVESVDVRPAAQLDRSRTPMGQLTAPQKSAQPRDHRYCKCVDLWQMQAQTLPPLSGLVSLEASKSRGRLDLETFEALHALFQRDFDGESLHARRAVEASQARHAIEHVLCIRGGGNRAAVYEHHDVGRD